MKIHIIDLHFGGTPHAIAAFLIESQHGLILIESGPYSTYPTLEKRIRELGHQPEDIQHLFLTHIHLDHAGAAWKFAQNGTKIYVHPRGKKHLVDPSRLWNSAKRIYQDQMETLWGDMQPIEESQISTPKHGDTITIGNLKLVSWYTPGHASHHIAWQLGQLAFTGDVAGVRVHPPLTVAPCPPPDIDLETWQESIALLKDLNLERIYLTHFGAYEEVNNHLHQLGEAMWDWAHWIKPYVEKKEDPASVVPLFEEYVNSQYKRAGLTEQEIRQYQNANPAWMSVYGLFRYWSKKLNLA